MTYRISKKSALTVSLYLTVPGFLAAFLLYFVTGTYYAVHFAAIWCVCVLSLGTYYFSSLKLFVGRRHVSLRHGRILKLVHRMPRSFITGCHKISTPFKTNESACVLIILCASGFYIVPGISQACAQNVIDKLIFHSNNALQA